MDKWLAIKSKFLKLKFKFEAYILFISQFPGNGPSVVRHLPFCRMSSETHATLQTVQGDTAFSVLCSVNVIGHLFVLHVTVHMRG